MNNMNEYIKKLTTELESPALLPMVINLAENLREVWVNGISFFLCGNGGSAGNAIHLANDYLYGVASNTQVSGMRVEALSANPAVISCLANDVGYSEIFSEVLLV